MESVDSFFKFSKFYLFLFGFIPSPNKLKASDSACKLYVAGTFKWWWFLYILVHVLKMNYIGSKVEAIHTGTKE